MCKGVTVDGWQAGHPQITNKGAAESISSTDIPMQLLHMGSSVEAILVDITCGMMAGDLVGEVENSIFFWSAV